MSKNFYSRCCVAKMTQKAEYQGKPLTKPVSQYSNKQQGKITFFHYCDECKKPTKPIKWLYLTRFNRLFILMKRRINYGRYRKRDRGNNKCFDC